MHLPFNQNKLFGCHSMKVLPLVILVRLESQCFTFAIREYKSYWERVIFKIKASTIT
jgi:hypothetical protein